MLIRKLKLNHRGFTLIELLAVLTIFAIIAAIAIPNYLNYIAKAEKEVCRLNSLEIERMYRANLHLRDTEHTASAFSHYMWEQWGDDHCPSGGEISYVEGKVICSIHHDHADKSEDEEGNGSVPYL